MLIHISAQDLQRNLHSYTRPGDRRLESFAPGWRKAIDLNQSQKAIRAAILTFWASKVEALGGYLLQGTLNSYRVQPKINASIG
jgi:hypothetical protein